MSWTKRRGHGSGGFTLIELLIVSPVILIIAIGTVTFLFNEYGGLVKQSAQLNLQLEAQNILFGLQDDLWYANQFTSDLNSNLVDTYQPASGWTAATTPPTLIVSSAALTKNRRDPNRQLVYINESSCVPPDGDGVNSVLFNNVIYFVSGTRLYKRVVSAPSSLPTCGTSFFKQSCPAAQATPACPADQRPYQ
jgi:type II secretory pathway pseudopilin PulG